MAVRRKSTLPPDILALFDPTPDAALIEMCDRYGEIHRERDHLYRERKAGYIAKVRAMSPTLDDLEAKITNTVATTAAGRAAKADAALHTLTGTGTCAMIARSALRDFINAQVSA